MLLFTVTTVVDFDLPQGWNCWLELQQTVDGTCAGKAELHEGNMQRCVLTISQQPSRDSVRERLKFRANHFVEEWTARHR